MSPDVDDASPRDEPTLGSFPGSYEICEQVIIESGIGGSYCYVRHDGVSDELTGDGGFNILIHVAKLAHHDP